MNRYELMRYERGLSRAQVANGAKIPLDTLVKLEDGRTSRPSAPTAKALADFYKMTVADFLGVAQAEVAPEAAA